MDLHTFLNDNSDIRKMFSMLTAAQQRPLYILTEAFPVDHPKLANIASKSSYIEQTNRDFIQLFKLA